MKPNQHSTEGFDTVPDRPVALTIALFAFVVVASTAVAVAFKESALAVVELYGGVKDPTHTAAKLAPPVTALVVAGATLLAAAVGRLAAARWPHQSGLESIAACARGEDRRISLPATLVRTTGTWLVTIGLLPIGRESAIMETGGAIGSSVARRFGGRGATMATAGIGAAFATAYHAPFAAVLYLEEHLRIRGSRRATMFAIGGALGGHLLATRLFDGHPLLPHVTASWSRLTLAGAIALIPATVAARLVLETRSRATAAPAKAPNTSRSWALSLAAAAAAGLVVACYPLTAGNGMDALRRAAVITAVGASFAIALTLAKTIGIACAFRAGAPGGALTPTMTVAAGAALLTVLALDAAGVGNIDIWAVVVLACAIGVAVGLQAPLTAVFLLPEMTGRLALLPATLAVVAVATLLDTSLGHLTRRLTDQVPDPLSDEDG